MILRLNPSEWLALHIDQNGEQGSFRYSAIREMPGQFVALLKLD